MKNKYLILFCIVFLFPKIGTGQDYPVTVPDYSFVKQEHNRIQFFGDSLAFNSVFSKMDSIMSFGGGKLNIVHFGGSHIQADIWTARVRERLQQQGRIQHPSRGLVFPYKAAGTNNPGSYNIGYSGHWEGCRNSVLRHQCEFGMTGITATSYDSGASITVDLVNKYHPTYYYTSVKVFHEFGEEYYNLVIDSLLEYDYKVEDSYEGYTEFFFSELQTEFKFSVGKQDSTQNKFVLYGMLFENEEPDIVYHSLGVNGASVPSYLRCNKLQEQFRFLKADLVIFSIGINDAYESDFSRWSYEQNYKQLIEQIKTYNPDVAILFTTNNDSYKKRGRRRYLNRNGTLVKQSMQVMSKKYGAGYWDMFEIMGGLNSAPTWVSNGMMKRDKIHFTSPGYKLMGDLLFNAIMQKYGEFVSRKNEQ